LAERAALLFVGQYALQRGHLRSQIGDVSLRVVDDREPLVEFLQALDGMLAGRGHGLIEMVRDRVEPLVHCAVKLGLPAGEHVAHRLDAHGGLRLQPRKLEQLLVGGLHVVPAQRPYGERDNDQQPRERDRSGQREEVIGHPRATVLDSAYENKI
jgi:hypothetical protein